MDQDPPAIREPAPQKLSRGALLTLLGGNIADTATTMHALSTPGAREANPLLGSQPGVGKILAVKAGGTLAQWALVKLLAKSGHPKLANALGYGLGGGMGAVAANNAIVASKAGTSK